MPSVIAAYITSTIMMTVAWLVSYVPFVGDFMMKSVPQGTGAPIEKQLQGFGDVRTLAYSTDKKTVGLATFGVKGDPGYLRTAMFISETALTLALEKQRLSTLGQEGGVLTPATIGGDVLAERLSKYGGVKIVTKDVSNSKDLCKEAEA